MLYWPNSGIIVYNEFERVGRAVAGSFGTRGKSGQDRARWWLMTTRGNPRESAAENTQPMALRGTGNGEMVR